MIDFIYINFLDPSTVEGQAFNVFFSLFFNFAIVSFLFLSIVHLLKRG